MHTLSEFNVSKWQFLSYLPIATKHLFLGALLMPAIISCAVNPATGGPNLVLMTENREKEIGKEEHEKVLSSMPVYNDEKLQAYVIKVGNKVAAVSDRPDLEYTFTIIDSPEINAFALPVATFTSIVVC